MQGKQMKRELKPRAVAFEELQEIEWRTACALTQPNEELGRGRNRRHAELF